MRSGAPSFTPTRGYRGGGSRPMSKSSQDCVGKQRNNTNNNSFQRKRKEPACIYRSTPVGLESYLLTVAGNGYSLLEKMLLEAGLIELPLVSFMENDSRNNHNDSSGPSLVVISSDWDSFEKFHSALQAILGHDLSFDDCTEEERVCAIELAATGGTLNVPQISQDRRARRLKLLADRSVSYSEESMVEFLVAETFVGSIIGRQGEKLSKIAKYYQVEIRLLPDDEGSRRIRVYGMSLSLICAARDELQTLYQTISLTPESFAIVTSRPSLLRTVSQRAGLFMTWVDMEGHNLAICGLRSSLSLFNDIFSRALNESSQCD